MKHATLPGFRDFYPPEMAVRTHITSTWCDAARRYGFEEYDGPPLEQLELYVEKSGEEIVRQLYNFEDKGGRAVALRPEMTPTLARMVGARAGSLRKPIRWFSTPQLFRYERTQRGRLREHIQWNVDILGEDDIAADAEVLAVALDGLRLLGLTADDIVARYNDRRLLEALLVGLGVPADRLPATYAVVDKLTREPADRIRTRLEDEVGLDAGKANAVIELFDDGSLERLRSEFGADANVAAELDRMTQYEARLSELDFTDYVVFDPAIVRGLAYYTGTVFEIFDRKGELRAVCGGGRYDRLLASVGGPDLPAVGFGMGDVVLTELLRERGLLPDTEPAVDVYIVAVGEEQRPLLLRFARVLREDGRSVIYALRAGGVGRQLKEADARGARFVIILGPDEVARGSATVRRMSTGEQSEVEIETLMQEAGRVLE
jgi:histidyl-tRNA synthetase